LLSRGVGSEKDRKLVDLLSILFEGVENLECFEREWFSDDPDDFNNRFHDVFLEISGELFDERIAKIRQKGWYFLLKSW
jgi:hypothetical protein